jgi:carbon storage regulator CsrA
MLVLSRKQEERIVFPNLGIAVEVLRVKGGNVRLGVDAPRSVRVLRGELADENELKETRALAVQERHHFRNRLNAASLALHILQKQLDAGKFTDAENSLSKALETFEELDQLSAKHAEQDFAVQPKAEKIAKQAQGVRRALVVEDNPNERELLAGYLRLCGYEVDAVEDGVEAIDYLAGHQHPDVILVDMQMPRKCGRDTITEIRCNPEYKGIKVFAVSGMDRKEMGIPLGDRGVDRWFSKPIKPAEFATELGEELIAVSCN